MNERIRELAEQVCAVQNVLAMGRHDGVLFTETELEKFAELIVRECMKLNSKELSITAIERLLPLYEEHFGVED